MPDEWLGELAFTHYTVTLSSLSGVPSENYWSRLTEWERTAWIEAVKAAVEAAIALSKR
jgi:hypothetical protein